ncbi:hypothetical protein TNCV_3723381 [Trichonephila clavipes]|nr:hypothetical protein TNCV_3723381 [Trichonephila clavipes]
MPLVSRSFEHHTICDSTICLNSTQTLRENILEEIRGLSSTQLTRGHAVRRLFIILPSCKGTIHLQTFMPSPEFEPMPNGTVVSITNRMGGNKSAE